MRSCAEGLLDLAKDMVFLNWVSLCYLVHHIIVSLLETCFPFSTPFFAESLFTWLDLACCFQGDSWGDAELAICDSVHVSDAGRPCNLAHLVRTILHRWHVKNFLCPISSTSISTCFCTRLPKIHSIPLSRLEPQLDYLFFELGLGFTSSGFTGCNMTLLPICGVFL